MSWIQTQPVKTHHFCFFNKNKDGSLTKQNKKSQGLPFSRIVCVFLFMSIKYKISKNQCLKFHVFSTFWDTQWLDTYYTFSTCSFLNCLSLPLTDLATHHSKGSPEAAQYFYPEMCSYTALYCINNFYKAARMYTVFLLTEKQKTKWKLYFGKKKSTKVT